MKIRDILCFPGLGAFPNDDLTAIRLGAPRDGHLYRGEPRTDGYRGIRQASRVLCVLIVLDDGTVATGDGVSVQYAGAAGREPLVDPSVEARRCRPPLCDAFVGVDASAFRRTSALLDELPLPTSVRYGVSQALLSAAAACHRVTVAEAVAREYRTGSRLGEVPIFGQCGEDRYDGVDRMILRHVDELPHGLINNAALVGRDGSRLIEYVKWTRDRVLAYRDDADYTPTLHFDCYGTIGEIFPRPDEAARFLAELGKAAEPLPLRIEQPVHARTRDRQIALMAEIRGALREYGSTVGLVADEWCNTLADVGAFIAGEAADMLQVKLPDVGNVDASIKALLACKRANVAAYCGGSCTETEHNARIASNIAMGVDADLLLARPGMGVDEAVMVVRNEMRRTSELVRTRRQGTTTPEEIR